ncbi:MAG: hypothetical protein U0T73_00040 [Chitinophagales bacterium]
MKQVFAIGDTQQFRRVVRTEDLAAFETGAVHAVYSTFAITRDAEWAGRLFVLEMKEADEEGIGTFVEVKHNSPAFLGETVVFTATLTRVEKNEVVCSFTATCGSRVIATGATGQKILKKERLQQLLQPV